LQPTFFQFSFSGTTWLKNSSPTQRNRFLGVLSAAVSSAARAVDKGTSEKQIRAWNRFLTYLLSIGIRDDDYLNSFDRTQKHKILSAFAQSIQEGCFGRKPSKFLKSDSVRASLDGMAQTFWLAGQSDP